MVGAGIHALLSQSADNKTDVHRNDFVTRTSSWMISNEREGSQVPVIREGLQIEAMDRGHRSQGGTRQNSKTGTADCETQGGGKGGKQGTKRERTNTVYKAVRLLKQRRMKREIP